MNNFCLYPPPVLRYFWKDPFMTPTPTTPLQASFTATPSPSTTPPPLKNFDHTLYSSLGWGTCFYAYFLLKKLVSGLLPTRGEGGLHEYSLLGVWLSFYGYFPLGNGYFIKINRKNKEKHMKKKKKNKANG